jgi:hypothetical protein
MLGFGRRDEQPRRVRTGRRSKVGAVESLESRQLLSTTGGNGDLYHAQVLNQVTRSTTTPAVHATSTTDLTAAQLATLNNEGKVVSGRDRDGDEWQITVHGPGTVIVTDATPLDGALDDDIVTIQLVNTSLQKTVVTGTVVASSHEYHEGVVLFQNLVALDGVKSIELNGFSLSRTELVGEDEVANEGDEVYLPGGVGLLSFGDIIAPIDSSAGDSSFDIVIGRPSSPLTVRPKIRLGSVFNSVVGGTIIPDADTIQTTPTVNLLVNGEIASLQMVSATGFANTEGYLQYVLPNVQTTGRTAIRATGIGDVSVTGSLRNTTLSRGSQPFSSGLSGLDKLRSLRVGGVTDGLGVDVSRGSIGKVVLKRGLGDPTGAIDSDVTLGTPSGVYGNAAYGLMGGQIVAQRLQSLKAGAANHYLDVAQNPNDRQLDTTNWTKYYPRLGRSLTNAAVVIDRSIGELTVEGDAQSTEINAGTNYASIKAGLEGARTASQIGRIHWRGNLVDSVVTATYRPGLDKTYTIRSQDTPGPGRLKGRLTGTIVEDGRTTVLGNEGTGFFARRKQGYLPPVTRPTRFHGTTTQS